MKCVLVRGSVCLVFLLFCIGVSDQRALPSGDEASAKGLYDDTDRVFILDQSNFETNVVNSQKAWVVEFYANWCGHCIKFAGTWKDLARSIYNWRDVVVIAAIDCADKKNEQVCRDYGVTSYPIIRYFPPKSTSGAKGDEFEKKEGDTLDIFRQRITSLVEKSVADGKGSPSWPNLKATKNLAQALSELPPEVKYAAVMFDKTESSAGTELILDFSSVKELKALRVLDINTEYVTKYNVKDFPSLYVQQRGSSELTLLPVDTKTRKAFYDGLKDFLKKQGIQVNDLDESGNDVTPNPSPKPEPEASYDDTVHQLDLEMALRQTLFNELRLQKVFESETLTALQKFLRVLVRYFPLESPGKEALQEFSTRVQNHKGSLTIDVYNEYIQPFESAADKYLMSPSGYVNCARSIAQPPCSLWLLFHTLTVQASAKHVERGDSDPQDVLNSIHGYVKDFFGCRECSKHFQQMAVSISATVNSFDSSVLWLWRAHNEVNARLAGEAGRVKIQFPSKENCPRCKGSGGDWDEREVLKYLKGIYTNISRERSAKQRTAKSTKKKRQSLLPRFLKKGGRSRAL